MDKIHVKVDSVRSENQRIRSQSADLNRNGNQVSSIRGGIDGRITSRRNIGPRLNEVAKSLNDLEKRFNTMHLFIDDSMNRYVNTDKVAKSIEVPGEKRSFWDGVMSGLGVVGDVLKGFGKGLLDTVVSTVEGLWNMVTHPIQTLEGLVHVIQHPIETGKGIWQAIKDSWNKDVINGDAESRAHWFGRAFGEVALAVVGTKGVDKAAKLAKGTTIVKEAGGVKVVNGAKAGEGISAAAGGKSILESTPKASSSAVKTYTYNMIEKPGPLAEIWGNPAANFLGGKYNIEVLGEDAVLYRSGKQGGLTIPGEEKNALGQWFTREPAESVVKVRMDSAVKAQWIDPKTGALTGTSPIEATYAIKIPKGTTIYEGPVGYQGGPYLGGENCNQIFVQEPWKIRGVEVISEEPIK